MHDSTFCHKLFEKALSGQLHKKRLSCLSRFVGDLLDYDSCMSVTEIGKKLRSNTSVKHKIKSADYFVGNVKFSEEISKVYEGLADFFWSGHQQLTVLVDWSGACVPDCFVLKASVVGHGRSIPLYQEVHKGDVQEQTSIHNAFLEQLKAIIPSHIAVTVITDAGFHRDWFRKVAECGWDFIGRVYSRYHYCPQNSATWVSVKDIEFDNTHRAIAHGSVHLGKTGQSLCGYLYSYKAKLSGKAHKKSLYPTHEKKHSNYYRNGWVIFSSLDIGASKLMRFYCRRMQIEQNFRDIKNERWGLGLRRNQSKSITRCRMLVFLGTLVTLLLWWVGLITETKGLQRQYQASSIRSKRIVSLVHLGRLVLRHQNEPIAFQQILDITQRLAMQYPFFVEQGTLNCP